MFPKVTAAAIALAIALSVTACSAAPESETGTDPSSTVSGTVSSGSTKPQPQFQEAVIADTEDCVFKITQIQDASSGYTLKAYMENKSDKDLMFSLDHVSVNGYMCDPFWANSVTAGMKDREDITFSSADFKANQIQTVTDITFTLTVYDSKDLASDSLVEKTYTIFPLGKEAAQKPVRKPQANDIVLFEDDYCAMIVTGFQPDAAQGYTVQVYLENKTDKNLMFSIDGAAVNGFMCDPFWAVSVSAGKCSNTTITWSDKDFADNDISEVEELTLPIRVYDEDHWLDAPLIDNTFTVNP